MAAISSQADFKLVVAICVCFCCSYCVLCYRCIPVLSMRRSRKFCQKGSNFDFFYEGREDPNTTKADNQKHN